MFYDAPNFQCKCGTEGRRLDPSLGQQTTEISANLAVNGYHVKSGSERRGMGSVFHILCPRYSGPLTPTACAATRLWQTFTSTFYTDTFQFEYLLITLSPTDDFCRQEPLLELYLNPMWMLYQSCLNSLTCKIIVQESN